MRALVRIGQSNMFCIFPPKMLDVVPTRDVVAFISYNSENKALFNLLLTVLIFLSRQTHDLIGQNGVNFNLCVIYAKKVNSEFWTGRQRQTRMEKKAAILFPRKTTARTSLLNFFIPNERIFALS